MSDCSGQETVAIGGSQSAGRDRNRTEDRGQRTGCKKPVPRSPSPVSCPPSNHQGQAGRVHSKSALRAPRTSEQIASRLCGRSQWQPDGN